MCGGNYVASNYLDTDVTSSINNAVTSTTAHALTQFIAADHADRTTATNDAFNDQLMPIIPSEIFARHIDQRIDFESYLTDPLIGMQRRAIDCLLEYGKSNDAGVFHKYLPWAASLTISAYGNENNYTDGTNSLSGRLPYIVTTTANSANSNINYNDLSLSEPMLRQSSPECGSWDQADEFWDQWKDHLFYAAARAHEVPHASAWSDFPCSTNECLDVENPGPNWPTDPLSTVVQNDMAAVVIFSGAKQSGQSRNNNTNPSYASADKADPANYLEGDNLLSIQISPTSATDPNRLFSKTHIDPISSTPTNDSVMCLEIIYPGGNDMLGIDVTCGASAQCTTDGTALAAYRAGSTNNCRIGTSGIDATCQTIANRIDVNNCPGAGITYSCERAARDFLSYDCLAGFATSRCQTAHTTLTTCS